MDTPRTAWLVSVRVVGRVLLDGIAPLLLPLWLVRIAATRILANPTTTAAAPFQLVTGDPNGEAWFYWWLHRAVTTGVPVDTPDVVCAPGGLALGNNFATRVDAWIALPFFHYLPFPENFNGAAMAVPVVNAWCAWLGLRLLGAAAPVALLGGAVLGFSDYVLREVSNGRSANALVGFTVAFLGALAATARGERWAAPVAAIAGALVVYAYPPYALVVAPAAAAVLVAGFVTTPLLRRRIAAGAAVVAAAVGYAAVRYALALRGSGFSRLDTLDRVGWETLIGDSLAWDWPARMETGFGAHHVWIPPVLFLAVFAVFAGRAAVGWLGVGAWYWAASLGPYVLERLGDADEILLVGGRTLALPLRYLVELSPTLAQVRPYRFAPLVAMGLVFALAAASRRSRWVAGAATLVFGATLLQQQEAGRLVFVHQPWAVPAPITWLAAVPGDFAVVELPAGRGHAYAALQLVHQKRRSEGHHDVTPARAERADAPEDCYTDGLVRALWALERGEALPEALAPLSSGARAAGYRYVVVYKRAYTRPQLGAGVLTALRAAFGAAAQEDGEVAIFAVPGE